MYPCMAHHNKVLRNESKAAALILEHAAKGVELWDLIEEIRQLREDIAAANAPKANV